jgi:hypothetical protein
MARAVEDGLTFVEHGAEILLRGSLQLASVRIEEDGRGILLVELISLRTGTAGTTVSGVRQASDDGFRQRRFCTRCAHDA